MIEQNDKHAYVLNNYIVYCIDFKNGTAWVKGPMVEKKGELEYADVHESLYFEGAVYPVTRFGVGAFAGEPLYSASIPYGVKEIQKNALAGTLIDSITVPGSVEFLGVQCFANSWIKKAVLEEGIKTIETGVFELCGKLEEIHLPASVEKTYIDVFSNCEALKSVTFAPGSRLKKIEKGMFYNCQKLSTIALPDGVQEIGSYAFSESGLKTITLPANLKKIGENAFANTPLVEIVIPGSVEEIASYAFFGCKNFKKITISSKFKDLRMLADIFGSDATYLFPDYNNLDNCPIFVWTE